MAFGRNWALVADYVDLQVKLKALLVSNGWSQVGATSIYKSAASDDRGNYAYVNITDNGAGLAKLEVSTKLDAAGTGLLTAVARNIHVGTANILWDFYIYDKWFHCFQQYHINYSSSHGTAGLFRPFPRSQFWYNPCWVHCGDNGSRGGWLQTEATASLSGRVWYPRGISYICSPCMILGADIPKPMQAPQRVGGGVIIQPASIWDTNDSKAMFGNIYNTVVYGGFYWDTADVSVPIYSVFEYGTGRVYEIPNNTVLHENLGMSVAFQIEGF